MLFDNACSCYSKCIKLMHILLCVLKLLYYNIIHYLEKRLTDLEAKLNKNIRIAIKNQLNLLYQCNSKYVTKTYASA